MSTAVLILTLNEIDGIKVILPKIDKSWAEEIVVVDGGSTDGTIEEAKKMGFKVIIQKKRGHGDAIVTGVNATSSDNIVIFGPDGNHEPEEIPRLIKKFEEGYDQVLISRFGKGSINDDANFIEWFGNKMFVFLANAFFCGNYTDTLNESRIISRKAYEELNFNALKMDSTQQLSIRGLIKKQKIVELVGNEPARVGGKKKMRPLPVGASLSWQIIREFFVWKF